MSKNTQSIEFYQTLAENIDDAQVIKFSNDNTHYDIDFIRKFSDKKESLLDLGSGTGLIVNNLTDDFKDITAVELFKEFSNYINGDNISICNENLIDFLLDDSFGMVTMFGTAHYFDEKESLKIYQNVFSMLKNNGNKEELSAGFQQGNPSHPKKNPLEMDTGKDKEDLTWLLG